MIITIDGPAGTGKTTVAKNVAERLGIAYFDTGAMYRAISWLILQEKIPLSDQERLEKLLNEFSFEIKTVDHKIRYFVSKIDVTEEIRSEKVNQTVSEVSANESVRKALWKIQRNFGAKGSGVFEGRDMGSVVFPDAPIKVYLTATAKVRAQRRLEEIKQKRRKEAQDLDLKKMMDLIKKRDDYDSSRQIAPLIRPKESTLIDTSRLSIDEVTEKILDIHKKTIKKMQKPWFFSKDMHFFYRFILFIAWCFCHLFYRHRVYGLEHFFKGGGILAPNHTSYLDPSLVAISWPEEVHFLARESLFKSFLFGRFIRALNAHPIDRNSSDISIFKAVLKILNEQKKLILFPEGRRSENNTLGEIKPGISLFVSKSQAALIPTYISGAYEVWKRGKKLPRFRGKTVCIFGSPIFWDSFSHLEKKEAQIAIADELKNRILQLKDWYEKGAIGTPP